MKRGSAAIPLVTAETIAAQYLRISTLVTRNADSLDFHECSVAGLLAALDAAYRAGRAS